MVNNLEKRARLFLSFDSLKGFKDYLKAKQKITVDPVELAPDALDELDWKIKQVQPGMMVTVVYYNQGEYVSITTGVPIVEADVPTKAGSNKFSALAGSNLNGYDVAIEISLVDINLEQELRTNDFKVQLLENGSVIKNLTGSNIDSNSSVVLKDMAIINVGTTYNYELRVWIQESGVSQNELMGKSFSGKIEISSSIKK